jgi:2-dehydro-3-deoxyphosphogluconate aldolase / (4S)-4-hydroxy-2-oxoglutarate aldolase
MIPVVHHLRTHSVLAILRGVPAAHVVTLGRALVDGGIRSIEVTFTDADAPEKIAALIGALSSEVAIGAGTVTTRERAEAAVSAGATFLVTPHVAPAVNAFARERGVPVICGAMTPTEIAHALDEGSAFIKLFPAGPIGPGYLQALLGPYPDLEVFAVGGVGRGNARAFLEAGAIGLGVGGALTSLEWTAPDFGSVTALARELTGLVATARARR